MASTAFSAQNSSLTIDSTDIGNIVSFTGFDGEAAEIDVTVLSSTAKEYILGLTDGGGSFTLEIYPDYTDAGQDALRAAAVSSSTNAYELTLNDFATTGTTIAFNALAKNAHNLNGAVDSALAGSVTLKVTGDLTITPGTP